MRQIPEKADIEEALKACDILMRWMKNSCLTNEEVLDAITYICKYVHHTKSGVEWIEETLRPPPKD